MAPPPKSSVAKTATIIIVAVVVAIMVLAVGLTVLQKAANPPSPSCPSGYTGTYPNCVSPPTPPSVTITQTGVTTGCLLRIGNGPYTFTFTLVNTGDTGGTATVDFYLNGNYVTRNSFYVAGHSSIAKSQDATYSCDTSRYNIVLVRVIA